MCGGTSSRSAGDRSARGLSPRVRGNLRSASLGTDPRGSIPACAGEPGSPPYPAAVSAVYPRVCGGTCAQDAVGVLLLGLSPRVRGNRSSRQSKTSFERSIPACAGEPGTSREYTVTYEVYPRVCGGTEVPHSPLDDLNGLSPRVRGNRPDPGHQRRKLGSIPACAGEPAGEPAGNRLPEVYPRVCGGTWRWWPDRKLGNGLSPRVRGNHKFFAKYQTFRRSIPACAGEPSGTRRGSTP